jgi:hypothetical protein
MIRKGILKLKLDNAAGGPTYVYSLYTHVSTGHEPTCDIKTDNFLHNPQTQHKICGLWLRGLSLVGL